MTAVRNDGGMFSSPPALLTLPSGTRTVFVQADGDSLIDVVEVGPQGAAVRLNLGGLLFGAPSIFEAADPVVRPEAAFDVDGDGYRDILAKAPGSDWMWAAGNSQGSFLPFVSLDGIDTGGSILGADLDGDGLVDVMTQGTVNLTSPPMAYLRQQNGAYAAPEVLYENLALRASVPGLQDLDGDGDVDLILDASGVLILREGNATQDAGGPPVFACFNVAENSTGCMGSLRAFGTPSTTSTDLELFASALPSGQFGMFIGSSSITQSMRPAGSAGFLCLGGSIGRYDGPGQIGSTGPSGTLRLSLDPTALETSQGQVPAVAGSRWGFQAWHRDVDGQGIPTSNFTGAVVISFMP